jgi:carboxypeptidase Taq
MAKNIDHLKELLGVVSDLESAAALLEWDQQTYMPPGGAGARAMQLATLSRLAHTKFVSKGLGEALELAKAEAEGMDPDSDEFCLVRKTDRDYQKEVKVPSEWVGEFSRVTALAHQDWEKARTESNFSVFEPRLEKIVGLRREYANFFAPYDHVYDPLLDDFEPGMKAADVKSVFDTLRPRLIALVQAIAERGKPVDDAPLHLSFDEKKQWGFGVEVAKAIGYDFNRGRQDKAAHPFTTGFGTGDIRITTRFSIQSFSTRRSSEPCTKLDTPCTNRESIRNWIAHHWEPALLSAYTNRSLVCGRTWSGAARDFGKHSSPACRNTSRISSARSALVTSTA